MSCLRRLVAFLLIIDWVSLRRLVAFLLIIDWVSLRRLVAFLLIIDWVSLVLGLFIVDGGFGSVPLLLFVALSFYDIYTF
jgi:hypothetical protein